MKRVLDDYSVTVRSGNVFADLGVPDPEIALAKAHIVVRISDVIRKRRLTQAQAARLMGITQPKVSAVIRGRSDYTMERLMGFLSRLGQGITINVDHAGGKAAGVSRKARENSGGYIRVTGIRPITVRRNSASRTAIGNLSKRVATRKSKGKKPVLKPSV